MASNLNEQVKLTREFKGNKQIKKKKRIYVLYTVSVNNSYTIRLSLSVVTCNIPYV